MARAETIRLFRQLAAEGLHLIISSHILHEVDMMSDRVVLLNNGYVVAEGDIHGVRSEMEEHPMQILIRCDRPSALAARVFEHFGARDLVEGCSAADFSAAAPRPASSALSVRRAEHLLGYELPTWQDALQRYFVEAAASIESRGIASAR
jgi:ABC-type multidrug transport system ATPase subunit